MLNPRCVCLESRWLQNMPLSAWSTHDKVVNFVRLFFGFSLHHLFMHMNPIDRHSPLPGPNGGLGAFTVLLHAQNGSLVGGEGLRDVHWHMHPHRTRTTNRSISTRQPSLNRDINLSFFCPKFEFYLISFSPLDHNKTWERTLSWLLARKQYLIIAHAAALTEAHTKREIYLERENSIHIYASRLHPQYTFNLFLQHRDEYFIHSKWGWSTCTCRRAQDFQTNPQLLGCWQLPQVSRGISQNTHRARRNRGWHNAMVV